MTTLVQSILICVAFWDAFLYSFKNINFNNELDLEACLDLFYIIFNILTYIAFANNYPIIFVSLFIVRSQIIFKLIKIKNNYL
jgi:hypothetical protein